MPTISQQTAIFLFTVGIGVFIGLVYDIFRILRKVFKHKNFIIHVEDFIFWIFVTCVMFYLMLNKNYGEIRGFTILGSIMGWLLYFFTLSFFVMTISTKVIEIIIQILKVTTKILLFPVKILFSVLKIPLRMLNSVFKGVKKPVKNVLQKSSGYAKIKARKAKRDINIIFKKI